MKQRRGGEKRSQTPYQFPTDILSLSFSLSFSLSISSTHRREKPFGYKQRVEIEIAADNQSDSALPSHRGHSNTFFTPFSVLNKAESVCIWQPCTKQGIHCCVRRSNSFLLLGCAERRRRRFSSRPNRPSVGSFLLTHSLAASQFKVVCHFTMAGCSYSCCC
jgi:hypothetical protein